MMPRPVLAATSLLALLHAACSGGDSNPSVAAADAAAGSDATPNDAGVVDAPAPDGGIDADVAVPFPAPFPAPPRVTSSMGPVLANPKIVPVFFTGDDSTFVTRLSDFTSKIGATKLWAAASEYGVHAATSSAPVMLTESAPATIDDATIQTWLAGKLNGNDPAWPVADANTVYALYYPSGTTITLQSSQSCTGFGGYHSNITLDASHGSANVAYAVVPRCATFDNLSGIDAVTATASHELIEAATDPYPLTVPAYALVDQADIYWVRVLGGGEVGDLCAQFPGSFTKLADLPAYTVQRFWSNSAALAGHDPCVPALPNAVYFNAAPVLPDMVPIMFAGQSVTVHAAKIPVGQTKTIDVDLFSDAPTSGPWTVSAVDFPTLNGLPARLSFSFDRTTGSNGDVLKLTITTMAAGNHGSTPFVLTSTLGSSKNVWIGVVAD